MSALNLGITLGLVCLAIIFYGFLLFITAKILKVKDIGLKRALLTSTYIIIFCTLLKFLSSDSSNVRVFIFILSTIISIAIIKFTFQINLNKALIVWLIPMAIAVLTSVPFAIIKYKEEEAPKLVNIAKVKINGDINTALELYSFDNSSYPTTEQGLAALFSKPSLPPIPVNWKGPYLEIDKKEDYIKDPWKNEYRYAYPGIHNPNKYDLYSLGRDRKEGTEDDINNWY